jgi:hypothetical protein
MLKSLRVRIPGFKVLWIEIFFKFEFLKRFLGFSIIIEIMLWIKIVVVIIEIHLCISVFSIIIYFLNLVLFIRGLFRFSIILVVFIRFLFKILLLFLLFLYKWIFIKRFFLNFSQRMVKLILIWTFSYWLILIKILFTLHFIKRSCLLVL